MIPPRLAPAAAIAALALFATLPACEKTPEPAPGAGNSAPAANAHDHSHDGRNHAHDHDHADHDGHGHGEPLPLGEATAGPYRVRASRDGGALAPGGEAAIDAWVEPAAEGAPKIAAVRLWIGAEDAAGSIKARAESENPADPAHWHTHAELPDPMPEGSKLWIEIEDDAGATTLASFDLKA